MLLFSFCMCMLSIQHRGIFGVMLYWCSVRTPCEGRSAQLLSAQRATYSPTDRPSYLLCCQNFDAFVVVAAGAAGGGGSII